MFRAMAAAGAAAFMLASAGSALAVSPYDYASGGGQTAQGDTFGFSAHDGPNGSSGYVTYQTATFDVGGAVTCLNAGAGRLATVGIVIERSSDPALIGQGFLLFVEDGDAVDSARPDRASYAFVDRPATRRCPPQRLTSANNLVSGNVVVEDSPDADPPEDPVSAT